jgi:hypothetical protein
MMPSPDFTLPSGFLPSSSGLNTRRLPVAASPRSFKPRPALDAPCNEALVPVVGLISQTSPVVRAPPYEVRP